MMSDADELLRVVQTNKSETAWERFWFSPQSLRKATVIRGAICVLTIAYALASWSDVARWFDPETGLLSRTQVAGLLTTSGLAGDTVWMMSPLFLVSGHVFYQLWLLGLIAASILALLGRGGRWVCVVAWLMLVAWANRLMIVAGLGESLLSIAWVGACFVPPQNAFSVSEDESHWSAGFAMRWWATSGTVVLLSTLATMLAGEVWWNGLGAYALVAPVEDRYFNAAYWLTPSAIHEPLTHLLVLVLTAGLFLAWRPGWTLQGKTLLSIWLATVAILTSQFLYGAALALLVVAIRPGPTDQLTATKLR